MQVYAGRGKVQTEMCLHPAEKEKIFVVFFLNYLWYYVQIAVSSFMWKSLGRKKGFCKNLSFLNFEISDQRYLDLNIQDKESIADLQKTLLTVLFDAVSL